MISVNIVGSNTCYAKEKKKSFSAPFPIPSNGNYLHVLYIITCCNFYHRIPQNGVFTGPLTLIKTFTNLTVVSMMLPRFEVNAMNRGLTLMVCPMQLGKTSTQKKKNRNNFMVSNTLESKSTKDHFASCCSFEVTDSAGCISLHKSVM